LLTPLLTRAFDGLGEDVSDTRGVLAENVCVDAQGHGRVGVAEAGGDDVDRSAAGRRLAGRILSRTAALYATRGDRVTK